MDSPADFNHREFVDDKNSHRSRYDTPMMVACSEEVKPEIFDLLMENIDKKNIKLEGQIRVKFEDRFEKYEPYVKEYNVLEEASSNFTNWRATFALLKYILNRPEYLNLIQPELFYNACAFFNGAPLKFWKFMFENSEILGIEINAWVDGDWSFNCQRGFHRLVQKKNPNVPLINYILENAEKYKIDVDDTDSNYATPFLIACQNGHAKQEQVIEAFIKHKHLINLNAKIGHVSH